jgi:hypothetical protein
MNLLNSPVLLFFFSLLLLWAATFVGDFIRVRIHCLTEDVREEFGTILNANLTLLGLLIGFSFSMAISRYDQRKNYEEAEANAIGTEYIRADLLPAKQAAAVRQLLRKYLDERILFYMARGRSQIAKVNRDTSELQNQLWSAISPAALSNPSPVMALVVSGMNDVLNSQGYTQAAWWNRIPIPAWILMGAIAIGCNVLIGYGAHRSDWRIFVVVPLAVSLAFFLIADIDSPHGGTILVHPQNLMSLSSALSGS